MGWLYLIIGLFVGTCLGMLISSLCVMAKEEE